MIAYKIVANRDGTRYPITETGIKCNGPFKERNSSKRTFSGFRDLDSCMAWKNAIRSAAAGSWEIWEIEVPAIVKVGGIVNGFYPTCFYYTMFEPVKRYGQTSANRNYPDRTLYRENASNIIFFRSFTFVRKVSP